MIQGSQDGPMNTILITVLPMLSFVVYAFLANRTKPLVKTLSFSLALLIPVALLAVGFIGSRKANNPVIIDVFKDNVSQTSLSGLPSSSYDMPGIKRDRSCGQIFAREYFYECHYSVEDYETYLSDEDHIEKINSAIRANPDLLGYKPEPFMRVLVAEKIDALDPYLFDNQECDIKGAHYISRASRQYLQKNIESNPVRKVRCVTVNTPNNQEVVYESHLNYTTKDSPWRRSDSYIDVPYLYYFIKNNHIVTIETRAGFTQKNSLASLFYIDPSFQPELFKFIDSFE